MKLGRIRTQDGAEVVVAVDGDVLTEVVDAKVDEIIAVCADPGSWPGRGRTWPMDSADIALLAPTPTPPSLRDFTAYADHTRHVLNSLGHELPDSWFDEPVFYFSNPRAVVGPAEPVVRPVGSTRLDYEAEIAVVIGRELRGPTTDDPLTAVAGFCLLNDWSARDLAAREMKHSLGPAKGKDFATSLGPWIVTPDEFPTLAETGVLDVQVTVSVNGDVLTDASAAAMTFNWPRILQRAAANTVLMPGDIIGGGTVSFGCLLELRTLNKELGHERYTWLQDGDVVELAAGPLGTLRTVVAPSA